MNFLETLSQLADEKIQLAIAITIDKDDAIVTITPKTKKEWRPFTMRGRPSELDAEFATQIENFKAGIAVIKTTSDYAGQLAKDAKETSKSEPKATSTTTLPAKKEEPAKTASSKTKSAPKKKTTTTTTTTLLPDETEDLNDTDEAENENESSVPDEKTETRAEMLGDTVQETNQADAGGTGEIKDAAYQGTAKDEPTENVSTPSEETGELSLF